MERTGKDQELELRHWAVPIPDTVESERSSTMNSIRDKYVDYTSPLNGPCSNLSYIYDSIAQLADQAGRGHGITLTQDQGPELVMNPDQLVTESAQYVNAANAQLAANKETLKQWHTYQQYGDYVGKIFNDLKGGREGPPSLQKSAIAIAEEIDESEKGHETSNPHRFDIIDLLERQAGLLEVTKGTSLSIDLAKFAVKAYAKRNKACHSGICELEGKRDAQMLEEMLRAHRQDLADILPEYERMNKSLYSNAIDYYQNSNIEMNHLEGRWQTRAKLKPRELSSGEVDIRDSSKVTQMRYFSRGYFRPQATDRATTKERGTKQLPLEIVSEPLTNTLINKGSSKRKALDELSRGLENTPDIPLWLETDLPKNLERKNDDAWQVHDALLLKVCQEQEKLAKMDVNRATLSKHHQLKNIANDVQASKDKAKRKEINRDREKTRLDKIERRKRAKLSTDPGIACVAKPSVP